MVLDSEQTSLLYPMGPGRTGKQYRVRFGIDLNGCDSVQISGNLQDVTSETIYSSVDYTFYFTSNDDYTAVSFYVEDPCQMLIDYVIIEEMDISATVLCDTDSVAGYRYGFNGKEKIDEQYGIEGTAYDFGARLYDSRLRRWMAVGLLAPQYPGISPFTFVNNMPIIAIDPNGKDIWEVVAWPTGLYETDDSGYMKLYAATYKEVKIQVEENGKTITKTYYEKTGYALIDNWPNGNNKFATRINYISEADFIKSIENEMVAYRVDTEKGVQGSRFDKSINPLIDINKTYYSQAEVKSELGVFDKAKKLSADNTPKYDHGDSYVNKNDCSSIIANLLLNERLINDKNLRVTTVTVNSKNYSFYIPNEIALDLKDKDFLETVIDVSKYSSVTRQKAKNYVEFNMKQSTP